MVDGAGSVTYGELRAAAERAARRLAALGVGEGDRVATTLPPGRAFAELLHALPLVGASLVPLNTRLTAAERAWQLEHCAARIVVEEPLDGDEADVAPRPLDPDAEWALLFTSGTSGTPRAVSLSHAQLRRQRLLARPGTWASTRTTAGSACCRSSTSAASRSSRARRSTARPP